MTYEYDDEESIVEFPRLTDEEHGLIIEALAYYRQRKFAQTPERIGELQEYIRQNVEHHD